MHTVISVRRNNMGFSRASKNLLNRVKNSIATNRAQGEEAARMMDKKYPGGWAQSPTNMAEYREMKKKVRGMWVGK